MDMKELIVAFRNFAPTLKNVAFCSHMCLVYYSYTKSQFPIKHRQMGSLEGHSVCEQLAHVKQTSQLPLQTLAEYVISVSSKATFLLLIVSFVFS
jgi:hypothetical protein